MEKNIEFYALQKSEKKRVSFALNAGVIRGVLIDYLNLPADCQISLGVPGGGDYSNMRLSVEDFDGLYITYGESS